MFAKPLVKFVVQAKGEICVRCSVAYGFLVAWGEFVEVLSRCRLFKRRQVRLEKLMGKLLQAAFAQLAECIVAFQCHLRRTYRVVDLLLYHDAEPGIEHSRLEG